jgi:hypothetical protein
VADDCEIALEELSGRSTEPTTAHTRSS